MVCESQTQTISLIRQAQRGTQISLARNSGRPLRVRLDEAEAHAFCVVCTRYRVRSQRGGGWNLGNRTGFRGWPGTRLERCDRLPMTGGASRVRSAELYVEQFKTGEYGEQKVDKT
jgi:hypothetical protein